ncbi:Ribokinase [Aphelenchoides fujianensis]|nr:Ribokinase [Aphelenchoides fujianensis]
MSKKIVVYVERFPRPGESVRGKSFHLNAGGKGANQAVAAAKLGGEVKMIGMVGDDLFADSSLENLKKAGVNVERVGRAHGKPTGCAMITVDENGENVIIVTRGANEGLTVEKAREMEDEIAAARLLMCQSEVPEEANLEAFRLARKHGVKTFFNPAPGNRDMDRSILEFTDIICMNETETDLIVQMHVQVDGRLQGGRQANPRARPVHGDRHARKGGRSGGRAVRERRQTEPRAGGQNEGRRHNRCR